MSSDVIILGGGLASLAFAAKLNKNYKITIVLKDSLKNGNSSRAQGGIAAALAANDSCEAHLEDTLKAGCYKNQYDMVKILVTEGKERLQSWIDKGMEFDRNTNKELIFGREGAHQKRRIIHAGGDQTGKVIMEFLIRSLDMKNITVIEHSFVRKLLVYNNRVIGINYESQTRKMKNLYGKAVILATGGLGGLFSESSNDPTLLGQGIVLAHQAGAELADLEYIQFHPTMIVASGKVVGLASEALRGEGAVLLNQDGKKIMREKHPEGDLAPRDVVSRVLFTSLLIGDKVFLDVSKVTRFTERFPQIHSICLKAGIDIQANPWIPVKPGAHFHMGGIQVNEWGETTVRGLYAIGETACNGVHGSNRLASNSLLEAIVFSERLAERLNDQLYSERLYSIKENDVGKKVCGSSTLPVFLPEKDEIKKMVSTYLGVVRSEAGLERLMNWCKQYNKIPSDLWLSKELFERKQMIDCVTLLTEAALNNKVSSGGHYIEKKKEITFS